MDPGDPSELHGNYSYKLDGITILFSISEGSIVCSFNNRYLHLSYSIVYSTPLFVNFPSGALVGGVVALNIVDEMTSLF